MVDELPTTAKKERKQHRDVCSPCAVGFIVG
jgi:hypothetical protein